MIKGTNICLELNNQQILDNVSFEIDPGTFTIFMGPSGAGKTSLLKCIANLYNSYKGSLFCDSKQITQLSNHDRAHHIGYIFQQFNLFDHLTVLENCSYPLAQLKGISKNEADHQVMGVLASLGIASLAYMLPTKLSGGQQQRVAIARALCLEPKVLLLDEPSSALDPQTIITLIQLLKKLRDEGITMIISSHDMHFVQKVADHIYFIDKGKIVESWNMITGLAPEEGNIAHFLRQSSRE